MTDATGNLTFLFSPNWWMSSCKLVLLICPRLVVPAFLLALSNCTSIYCDSVLKGGIDIGLVEAGQVDLGKAIGVAIALLIAGIVGLVSGLISLTFWMLDLTAISKMFVTDHLATDTGSIKEGFSKCLKQTKEQSKYYTGVWLFGFLYLLGPVLPLSALISFNILNNPQISMFGEPILALPNAAIMPMHVLIGVLSLITIDYTIILTVCSSTAQLKPKSTASLASDIFIQSLLAMSVLNIVLIVLNIGISAPFLFLFTLPQFTAFAKDVYVQVLCQIWFAVTCMFTWPLSVLIFAEYLRPRIQKQQASIDSNST